MTELKNELLKHIKITFMSINTSMVHTLFKSKFVSSLLRFSMCNGHVDTKNPLFRKQLMYFNIYIVAATFILGSFL